MSPSPSGHSHPTWVRANKLDLWSTTGFHHRESVERVFAPELIENGPISVVEKTWTLRVPGTSTQITTPDYDYGTFSYRLEDGITSMRFKAKGCRDAHIGTSFPRPLIKGCQFHDGSRTSCFSSGSRLPRTPFRFEHVVGQLSMQRFTR